MPASIRLQQATPEDVPALVELHVRVARDLTRRFGEGHWSGEPTERGILFHLRISRVFVVKSRGRVMATVRLSTRRPWAIDPTHFTPCKRPLYLLDMAVEPKRQGSGLGRQCMTMVPSLARAWQAGAIRLDAYDGPAGAGPFYEKCGYREVGRVSYRGTALVYLEYLLEE